MMGAPKKPGYARHLHFDPYVHVYEDDHNRSIDNDARIDRFLAWCDAIPFKKRTGMVFELIVAAVNGELGIAPGLETSGNVDDESKERLNDLLENMVLDEE